VLKSPDPSLALNGIVAYVAMLASLIALETLSRKFGSAH
jgi:hypothetical protein